MSESLTPPVPMRLIVHCAAEAFGVEPRDLYLYRRPAAVADARAAVYWLAWHIGSGNKVTIGRELGGRDHTTVVFGIKACEERRALDPAFRAKLAAAANAIEARLEDAGPFADPDVVAVAERVVRDPRGRGVTSVSTVELVAVCARLLDLEDLAGSTFQLLANLDDLIAARGARSREDGRERPDAADAKALATATKTLINTVTETLALLGYADDASSPIPTQRQQGESDHGHDTAIATATVPAATA
jgi:Bacterial dnaA protein helix-turn-helix